MVSVVIPACNQARFLPDAIGSVLNQVYPDYEVIVVDDGSADDTRAVVVQYGDQVRYLWQANRGLSGARNTGIRAARGAFIGLLDADDLYEPKFLSTLVPLLDANPDVGAVYCGYRFVDIANNPLPQVETRVVPPDQFYHMLVDGNFLAAQCFLVRRSCYEEVGLFDESLRACEDWDMWLRIAQRYPVLGVNQVLTRVRVRPGSMSSDPERMYENRIAVLRKHSGSEEPGSSWAVCQKRAYARAHLRTAVEYLQHGDPDEAVRHLRRTFFLYPEVVEELDVFYELGCGNQPKGWRGDFATLDIESNAQVLIDMLDQVFGDGSTALDRPGQRAKAYANAYLALGLLGYGGRQMHTARQYLLQALVHRPQITFTPRFVSIFMKSLLGYRLIRQLKRLRHLASQGEYA